MGTAFRKFRAFVLVVILSITVVPIAAAGPRDGDLPRFERVRSIVAKLLKSFGVTSNSDAVVLPRP